MSEEKSEKVSISVESKEANLINEDDDNKDKSLEKKEDKVKLTPEELSEEDQILKDGLELAVIRLEEDDTSLHRQALDHLITEIRSSTSSMTAVPKPLKFLRPHYEKLKSIYAAWPITHELKKKLSDVLSVLAMTMAEAGSRESLRYKLKGTTVDIASWGHEYIRSLSGEISEEYNQRLLDVSNGTEDLEVDDLIQLVDDILPFQMQHNSEVEAIDLLLEVQQINKLIDPPINPVDGSKFVIIDERNYQRVCLYLIRLADYMVDPDDYQSIYDTIFHIYIQQKKYIDAFRIAVKLDEDVKINELFSNSKEIQVSSNELRQMAYILGRHRSHYVIDSSIVDFNESPDVTIDEINDIIGNTHLSERFLSIALSMDLLDPKTPEDIYKTSLLSSSGGRRNRNNILTPNATAADSARGNLASSFVNAFVNAGFNRDKLMMGISDEVSSSASAIPAANNWVFKNKDHGMMSAVASLGMILLWNVDEGFNQIDKYFHQNDENIKAGACLGVGIVSSGVRNESDPALAILSDYLIDSSSHLVRLSSIIGLGIAYAGTRREDLQELLTPYVCNIDSDKLGMINIIEASFAALSLGLIYVGTCHDEISSSIIQRMMESSEEELNHPMARYLCLGLGLLFLGKTDRSDIVLEAVRAIEHAKLSKYAEITLDTCAYAGSGNVLKIQSLLRLCAEHLSPPSSSADATTPATSSATASSTTTGGSAAGLPAIFNIPGVSAPAAAASPTATPSNHQSIATLGIALISLGEDISTEMALRTFDHLQHYCDLPVKRVVPLALALLYTSNPDYQIVDQLSRLSHDQDVEISQGAIIALGLVSAGTNNSRVSGLLRQLSDFYAKEANHLFIVRIAQGLNAMGKGLIGLSSFHSDRLLLNGPALAGLLVVLHACLDMNVTILDKYHYLLYYLSSSMNPRYLITLDSSTLQPLSTSVRVGQAVETVGQAGRPKTITGFQTHSTPVLLGYKERAELATRDYRCISSVIENIVILDKVDVVDDSSNIIDANSALN